MQMLRGFGGVEICKNFGFVGDVMVNGEMVHDCVKG